jgi:TolB-like protein/DNA-binding winged helix-turn-helix (wHTH) protein
VESRRPEWRVVRFGVFELDLAGQELRKAGALIRLQPHPFQVLALLVTRAGQVVTREELRRELWGNDTFVDFEQGLNYCIRQIRAVLGDDAQTPRFVETFRRRGYRFIAPVEPLVDAPRPASPVKPSLPAAAALPPGPPGFRWKSIAVVAPLVVALLVVAGSWAWHRSSLGARQHNPKVMLAVLPFASLNGQAEKDQFSVGLTEELTAQLVGLRSDRLAVIPRDFALRYKEGSEPLSQVGHALGADYLLVGSVLRNGTRVRITAELVDVHTGTDRWAKTYEFKLGNIVAVQSEVGRAMADEIISKLAAQH